MRGVGGEARMVARQQRPARVSSAALDGVERARCRKSPVAISRARVELGRVWSAVGCIRSTGPAAFTT